MAWSTQEIIDIIFVPIYFILFLASLYALFKHASNKRITFGLLFLFPLIRCIGNILLVAAMEEEKKSNANVNTIKDLYTGGFILQLAGFGLLFSAGLNLVCRASLYEKEQKSNEGGRGGLITRIRSPQGFLHLLNTISTILLIIGLTNSTSAFSSATNQSIDILAKVGIIMLLVATALLTILTFYHLFIVGPVTPSARLILTFVFFACFPMIARMAWSTYRVAGNKLTGSNVWASLVLQNFCETLAISIFIALSFVLDARGGDGDLDERKEFNDPIRNNNPSVPMSGNQQQQQQYSTSPIDTYPPNRMA